MGQEKMSHKTYSKFIGINNYIFSCSGVCDFGGSFDTLFCENGEGFGNGNFYEFFSTIYSGDYQFNDLDLFLFKANTDAA